MPAPTAPPSRDLGADFVTPKLDLDALDRAGAEPRPLLNVKLNEILDFLAADRRAYEGCDRGGYLREAVDRIAATNVLPRAVIEQSVRMAAELSEQG